MIVKNNVQLLDDNGINISGKLCVIKYTYEEKRNKLDGVYGVSGAERSIDDDYIVKIDGKSFGIFKEGDDYFTSTFGTKFSLNRYTITDVKILDIENF